MIMLIRDTGKRRAAFFVLPFFVMWLAAAHGQSPAPAEEHEHPVPEKLGRVQFPTSCSSKVQKNFERSVALLHSFAYSAAEKTFSEVIIGQGQAEIERAKQLGGSERERAFIDALSLVYANADSVPYQKRLNRYA